MQASYRDAEYMWRVRDYKSRVTELYPEIPHQLLNNCSIFDVDALILGCFLESFDVGLTVYEIGSFVGVSSYLFASHPNVSKLFCIDPNPKIVEEATANSRWARKLDLEAIGDLRVFDVAREVLGSLDRPALEKIRFMEGVAGSESLGAKTDKKWTSAKIDIPLVSSPKVSTDPGEGLLAYVDGLHTKEGVREDLEAVFKRNPQAIAILDDCRRRWGPLVQAGTVEFMEGMEEQGAGQYTFRLFADLGPGLATSNLGLVYHSAGSKKIEAALLDLSSKFSQKIDPVKLLIREYELTSEVNRRIDEILTLKRKLSQLELRNEFLNRTLQRRSHQAAELMAKTATRIPGVRNLIRNEKTEEH